MRKAREYQETMQKLYDAAMIHYDKKLAGAVMEVRDLVVEYKNIINGYEKIDTFGELLNGRYYIYQIDGGGGDFYNGKILSERK